MTFGWLLGCDDPDNDPDDTVCGRVRAAVSAIITIVRTVLGAGEQFICITMMIMIVAVVVVVVRIWYGMTFSFSKSLLASW